MFVTQANAFLDAVEGKKPVLCTLDEGLQTLKVNLAALASWDEGRWKDIV
jgi:predicted dehydrogenase